MLHQTRCILSVNWLTIKPIKLSFQCFFKFFGIVMKVTGASHYSVRSTGSISLRRWGQGSWRSDFLQHLFCSTCFAKLGLEIGSYPFSGKLNPQQWFWISKYSWFLTVLSSLQLILKKAKSPFHAIDSPLQQDGNDRHPRNIMCLYYKQR